MIAGKCLLFCLLIKTIFAMGFFRSNLNANVFAKITPAKMKCFGFDFARMDDCEEYDKEVNNEIRTGYNQFNPFTWKQHLSSPPPMITQEMDEYGIDNGMDNRMNFGFGGGISGEFHIGAPITTPAPTLYAYTTEEIEASLTPKITAECGIAMLAPSSRVVGGRPAKEMEYPWQVGIQRIDTDVNNAEIFLIRGGGAIINNRWILTAAHVFNDVQLNETRGIYGTISASNPRKTIKFDKIITHKDYDVKTFSNDIALVRVDEDMQLFPNETTVNAICLPEKSKIYTGMAVVTGWGLTNANPRSENPDILMGATLQLVDDELCSKLYPNYNSSVMLCAGEPRGEKDSCDGDSGGPLFVYRQDRAMIIGVVSFGQPRTCGKKGTAAVYTRVCTYVDWIDEVIAKNS